MRSQYGPLMMHQPAGPTNKKKPGKPGFSWGKGTIRRG